MRIALSPLPFLLALGVASCSKEPSSGSAPGATAALRALEGLKGVKKATYDDGARAIVVTRESGTAGDEEIIRVMNQKGSFSPKRIR